MLVIYDLTRYREALSRSERQDYIRAVKCLVGKPPISDPKWASAARTRYDDFVAVHTNVTPIIHGTGNFFAWHRYYLWTYETALRDECGYKGYQPVRYQTSFCVVIF